MTDRSVDMVSSNTADQPTGTATVNLVLLGAGGDVELWFTEIIPYDSTYHLDALTVPSMIDLRNAGSGFISEMTHPNAFEHLEPMTAPSLADLSGFNVHTVTSEILAPITDTLVKLTLGNGT